MTQNQKIYAVAGAFVAVLLANRFFNPWNVASPPAAAAKGPDSAARLACESAAKLFDESTKGLLTESEIRAQSRAVYDDAKLSSDRNIASGAERLLRAATAGNGPDFATAIGGLVKACR